MKLILEVDNQISLIQSKNKQQELQKPISDQIKKPWKMLHHIPHKIHLKVIQSLNNQEICGISLVMRQGVHYQQIIHFGGFNKFFEP